MIFGKSMAKATAKVRDITAKRDLSRASLIDEFGQIATRLEGHKKLERRYEQLRALILQPYQTKSVEESFHEEGYQYSVQISPCGNQRAIISMSGLYDRLGAKTFLNMCQFSLEKLDTVLLPRDQDGLVAAGRNGPRIVKALARYSADGG